MIVITIIISASEKPRLRERRDFGAQIEEFISLEVEIQFQDRQLLIQGVLGPPVLFWPLLADHFEPRMATVVLKIL